MSSLQTVVNAMGRTSSRPTMGYVLSDPLTEPRQHRSRQQPVHLQLATFGAAGIAFMAAVEPNLTLRYGPFIAVGVFILSYPHRFRVGATEWALATFVLWVVLSQFWTRYPAQHALTMTGIMSLAIIFIGVRAAVRWGHNVRFVVAAFVVGCLVGLARTSWDLLRSDAAVLLDPVTGRLTQVGDLNVNYIAYGVLAAVLLLTLVLHARQFRSKRERLVEVMSIVALSAGVVATGTRGAQVALVLLGLWVIVSRFGTPLKTVVVSCIAITVAVSFGWIDWLLLDFDFGERSQGALSGRLGIWPIARETWAEAPIHGVGLGAVRAQTAAGIPAHNFILEIGTTLGAIGLLLLIAFFCFSLTDRLGELSDRDRRFRLGAVLLVFTPVLLSGTWEYSANAWVALALLSQPILIRPNTEVLA